MAMAATEKRNVSIRIFYEVTDIPKSDTYFSKLIDNIPSWHFTGFYETFDPGRDDAVTTAAIM
jgi:hypothetical protein